MNGDQVLALWTMIIIAIFGIPAFSMEERAWKIGGVIWIVVWALPPLVVLWIKGVFG